MVEPLPFENTEVVQDPPQTSAMGDRVAVPKSVTELPRGLHLFVEHTGEPDGEASEPREPVIVAVPPRPSYLNLDDENHVSLPSVVCLFEEREPGATALCFEPVRVARRPGLLVMSSSDAVRPRINGRSAPRVALLRAGDQLHLGSECVLHVVQKRRLEVLKPPSDLVGRACGYCRVAFVPSTTVAICECGVSRHLELLPKPKGEPLVCARLAACECGSRLPSEAGDLARPEL